MDDDKRHEGPHMHKGDNPCHVPVGNGICGDNGDVAQHIAVSPPEFQKAHTVLTCPKCGHKWNPNKGYGLFNDCDVHDHVYDAGAEGI